jgi:hypothetical protein
MNHGPGFWKFNQQMSAEMAELRSKGFTGEGMYSRGRSVGSGDIIEDRFIAQGEAPMVVCSGSWTRRRKRVPKSQRKRRRNAKFNEEKVGRGRVVASDGTYVDADQPKKRVSTEPKFATENAG